MNCYFSLFEVYILLYLLRVFVMPLVSLDLCFFDGWETTVNLFRDVVSFDSLTFLVGGVSTPYPFLLTVPVDLSTCLYELKKNILFTTSWSLLYTVYVQTRYTNHTHVKWHIFNLEFLYNCLLVFIFMYFKILGQVLGFI